MQDHINALIIEAAGQSDHIDDLDHPRETTWHLATMRSTVLLRVELLPEQEMLSFAAELPVEDGIEIPAEMLLNFNSLVEETGVFISLDGEGGPLSVRRMVSTRGISVGDVVAAAEATAPKVLSLGTVLPHAAGPQDGDDNHDPGAAGARMTVLRG